jgi:hypothetical protein
MGRREAGQGQFFYSFDLDEVVPPDHLVRQIDGLLDLSWVHKELAPYYSHTGRPSIDPVLMIRSTCGRNASPSKPTVRSTGADQDLHAAQRNLRAKMVDRTSGNRSACAVRGRHLRKHLPTSARWC